MATGYSDSEDKLSDNDICNCSICLEKCKTPKYLPCLHVFCEACLKAYIKSTAKSGETPPEHFNCPLCRAEVKPPDPTASVEDWASLMPVKHMIDSLVETPEKSSKKPLEKIIQCDPCTLDGETISAEFWCFECQEYLCTRCKREHSRQKSSRMHKLVSARDVSEQDAAMVVPEVEEPCTEHKGEMLKVYCIDHQKMCCVLCLSLDHRKCENIKTLDDMAEIMTKNSELEQLSDKMKEINSKVERISSRKRENITSVQNQQTTILDKADTFIREAKTKLDKCHQEFKDKVSYLHKEQTTKLLEAADKMDIFQNSVINCQKTLEAINEFGSPRQIFVTFEKIRERIKSHSIELEVFLKEDKAISYDFKISSQVMDMRTLTTVAELEVKVSPLEESLSVDMGGGMQNARNVKASVTVESPCIDDLEPVRMFDVKSFRGLAGGTFLNDDRLLLVDCTARTLTVCSDDGEIDVCHSLNFEPWDAVQHSDDNIYVTSASDNNIRIYRLSSNIIQETKSIKIDKTLGCINAINITPDNHVLVERTKCIYVMTMDGKTLRTIKTSGFSSFIATSTSGTESVFYYCDDNEVVCQSLSGEELLRYKIPNIKRTRGIAVDKWGNIYVCGVVSRNVYVVSQDRKSSRVLISYKEGVYSPYKVGFDRSGNKFFVTDFKKDTVTVYKLNLKK